MEKYRIKFPTTDYALRLACRELAKLTGKDAAKLEGVFIFRASAYPYKEHWLEGQNDDIVGGPAVAAQIIINRAIKRRMKSFTRTDLRRLSLAKSTWKLSLIEDALSYMIINDVITEDISGNRTTYTLTGKGIPPREEATA